ncbi:YceD family protein [Haloechinothrix halophila]|uniref:YceD family protein n=1 Tax=Haloechinothrix halophila TaxID=1069073 RepID=UPI000551BAD2|nr:YceD family protein [Haloechinothrix halophila]
MSDMHRAERSAALDPRDPWVIDTRDLGRRAGSSRDVRRQLPVAESLGVSGVIEVRAGAEFALDVLLEAVVEGVLASGEATAPIEGACSRCLDPIADEVSIQFTELFAYPDSATEETTDEDEVSRLVDDLIDLQPVVRDAAVLALPQVPLCSPDCPGLCAECGIKWADLEPGHGHEKIDPRWAALVERFGEPGSDRPTPEGGTQ